MLEFQRAELGTKRVLRVAAQFIGGIPHSPGWIMYPSICWMSCTACRYLSASHLGSLYSYRFCPILKRFLSYFGTIPHLVWSLVWYCFAGTAPACLQYLWLPISASSG